MDVSANTVADAERSVVAQGHHRHGQYGNGFKGASDRIAQPFIPITRYEPDLATDEILTA